MKRRIEATKNGCVHSAYIIHAIIVADIEEKCNMFLKNFKIRHIFQLNVIVTKKLKFMHKNLLFPLISFEVRLGQKNFGKTVSKTGYGKQMFIKPKFFCPNRTSKEINVTISPPVVIGTE